MEKDKIKYAIEEKDKELAICMTIGRMCLEICIKEDLEELKNNIIIFFKQHKKKRYNDDFMYFAYHWFKNRGYIVKIYVVKNTFIDYIFGDLIVKFYMWLHDMKGKIT